MILHSNKGLEAMNSYTVKYKGPKHIFWRKLENVIADGIIENVTADGIIKNYNVRWFALEDETRVEIPNSFMFKFGKERSFLIEENMEKETENE